jgi:hypothetical protein
MEIKPNFIFLLFSVLFGVIGLGSLLSSLHTHEDKGWVASTLQAT